MLNVKRDYKTDNTKNNVEENLKNIQEGYCSQDTIKTEKGWF